MFTPRAIIPTLLIGGLVVIEVLAGNPLTNSAQSQHQLTNSETELILSILHGEAGPTQTIEPASTKPFLDFSLPDNPGGFVADAKSAYGTIIGTRTEQSGQIPSITNPSSVLSEVLPPIATPLYYAYQDGGIAWYIKGTNVLVIFPNETIRSFNSATGAETDWLQDKLARLPVSDASAYQSYQTTYHAKVAAETRTWSLFEFPSGGVLKVSKPAYLAAPNTGGTSINLPDILPGYGN
jgi:hypothetical protein